jgi:hypothetical protein
LAGFDYPRAEPALRRAAQDRDWQVRQAADELMEVDDGRQSPDAAPASTGTQPPAAHP